MLYSQLRFTLSFPLYKVFIIFNVEKMYLLGNLVSRKLQSHQPNVQKCPRLGLLNIECCFKMLVKDLAQDQRNLLRVKKD